MKRAELLTALRAQRDELSRIIDAIDTAAPPSPAPEPAAESGPEFFGHRLVSRFSGRCAVCGDRYFEGDPVLYSKALRRAAHPRCGTEVD